MGFALGPIAEEAGYRLAAYDTIGSTSTEALARARAGDPGKLWVVSREQTAGHGRRGRAWSTPPGNLAASLLLNLPSSQSSFAATLGFVAGLALSDAIRGTTLSQGERVTPKATGEGLEADEGSPRYLSARSGPSRAPSFFGSKGRSEGRLRLKWPNDILLDGAKVAGILLQAVSGTGGAASVVIGIGVNVAHAPTNLPYPVTSLAAAGIEITAEQLFSALSDAWVERELLWDTGRGFLGIRSLWLERAAGLGAPIAVQLGSEVCRGTFETIDGDGRLILRIADGRTREIAAGEVYFGAAATAVA
jgi:BirA family biotin operon repressor/biotin-[acetyl-CoA-carboxylase] ligase